MDAWMYFEAMLHDVFQQPGAYPYPFGSLNLGWLYEVSDDELRRLSLPRLRDQAVSVDAIFAEWKGRYLALHEVAEHQGMTPYLEEEIARTARSLGVCSGYGYHVVLYMNPYPEHTPILSTFVFCRLGLRWCLFFLALRARGRLANSYACIRLRISGATAGPCMWRMGLFGLGGVAGIAGKRRQGDFNSLPRTQEASFLRLLRDRMRLTLSRVMRCVVGPAE